MWKFSYCWLVIVRETHTVPYTTWALVSVLIRDGFGACFVVPEVVQTILHFGNTVAVLILAKNVLLLFVRKIHEVTPKRFFDITAFFISYLLNGWIDLLINHYTQNRQAQVTCNQVWLQSPVWFRSYEMIYKKNHEVTPFYLTTVYT